MNEVEVHALMMSGLAGDANAHKTLLLTLASHLRPFLRRKLFSNPEEAEDIVQDVLLAIHLKRHMYDPTQPLTAWVYAIARYKLIDHFRRSGRRGIQVPLEEADSVFAASDHEAGASRQDVGRLLAQLPEKQRRSIQLFKLDQLSLREVADQEGMTESDVKVSVHRGLKKLSRIVAKEDLK